MIMRTTNSLNISYDSSRSATMYRITWIPSSMGVIMTNETSATLLNLSPGTPYNITVVAINAAAESGEATAINQYTSKNNYSLLQNLTVN